MKYFFVEMEANYLKARYEMLSCLTHGRGRVARHGGRGQGEWVQGNMGAGSAISPLFALSQDAYYEFV